jgi:ABC-type transport system involved in cytochrome c biogenesis permease subunit
MKLNKLILLLLIVFTSLAANASEFKRILIADQGRIKPLDSFSKTLLLKISGNTKNHNHWLKEALFEPEKANQREIFRLQNPDLKEALNLETKKKLFSFNEIEKTSSDLFKICSQIANKKEEELNAFDRQALNLRQNFYSYINVTNAFLYNFDNQNFTISAEVRDSLGLDSTENSLYKILQKSARLSDLIEKINTNSNLTSSEKELIDLSLKVYSWVENFKNFDDTFISETKFNIIPLNKNEWLTPWQVIFKPNKETNAMLWFLSDVQNSYQDKQNFNSKLKAFNNKVLEDIGYKKLYVESEILYNAINPFKYAMIFYLLGFLLIALSYYQKPQWLFKSAVLTTSLGFLLNMLGLILRIIIMQRAPVSNLYETFIFIAWSIALLGLAIFLFEKTKVGIILSSLTGFALLLISFKFAAEGDTMQSLIAVLNSNFWLSTHVIAITLGYAGVFAAGVLGHVFIIQKLTKQEESALKKTKSYLLGILGFGLTMSMLGTLLGGIWADQSWGRFWGWDPKENGALLIVLWSALIFHARLSGFIKDIGLAQASIFGSFVVMLSWLGVNLLGVGLHSYGFTSGLFYALLAYGLFEIIFIATTSFLVRK